MSQPSKISRRRFLALAGGGLGLSILACGGGLTVFGGGLAAPVDFTSSGCKGGTNVQKILVAYASKCGSTGEVAQAIGEVLCGAGATVDVARVQDVKDVSGYSAIVLGSATRMGKILPEALKFAEKNRSALAAVPVAYFNCGTTMRQDTPANRATVTGYLDPLCQVKQPVSLGMFAGKVDHTKMEQPWRFMLSMNKSPDMADGDFRDWQAIRGWAAGLVKPLLA